MSLPRVSVAALIACVSTPWLALAEVSGPDSLPQWAVPNASGITVLGLPPVNGRIAIDQFGYLPDEQKFAVISDPQVGYNAKDEYTPGPECQLRRVRDQAIILRGAPVLFREGETDRASGDRGWWFDFSAVREPDDYFVFDPQNGQRSHVFRVSASTYDSVLRDAVRVFYYQRENFAHRSPYAEAPWEDKAAYTQDEHTRSVLAKEDAATERDLSGGWMDAGDTNKYPTFLPEVIHPLLYAWCDNPRALGDNFGIPESGNGLSDLLDEMKWELDWLLKMQDVDGGVFLKMGHDSYAGTTWPLSRDRRPRYYGPKASSSTLATAGILAHAARVYAGVPAWRTFAADLQVRAERAWHWYQSHERSFDADHGEIKSGDADKNAAEHDRWEAIAAMHLWALTRRQSYHDTFVKRFETMRQLTDETWSPYEAGQAEALLDYTRQPGADPRVSQRILQRLRSATTSPDFMPQDDSGDLYRAWMIPTAYHWGNNQIRAGYGIAAINALDYLQGDLARPRLRQRALDLLHSFHGVNPLGLVYLSNMAEAGGEVCVMRVYHEWFAAGSPLSARPAPGYVTGGPNRDYGGNIAWLKQQPDAKCYADLNLAVPEQSWELSEPAIYYQAMYVRLLAHFVGRPSE